MTTNAQTIEVEVDLLQSCLELFEDIWAPCDADCECIIHPLRAVLGKPDDAEARK